MNRIFFSLARNTLLGAALTTLCACGGGGGGGSGDTGGVNPPPSTGITLSGTIGVPAGISVDNDVNDPHALYAENDSPASAQSIANPTMVGGYANSPGAGNSGRSQVAGDVSDFYQVTLSANQTLLLSLADPDAGDLDLYLWDSNGTTILDASLNTGPLESLTVAAAGTYFVEVQAKRGATNYTLGVGQNVPAAIGDLVFGAEFVPGEVVARFRDDRASFSTASSGLARVQALGLQLEAGEPEREMLLQVGEEADLRRAASVTADAADADTARRAAIADSELQRKWDTLQAIKALRLRPDVALAEPNFIRRADATPNDEFYRYQWHYPMINVSGAWDLVAGRGDVVVAVIDTGVLLGHPDLQGQLLPGFDFIRDPNNAQDGDGIDSNPDDPGDDRYNGNSSFHGTHVSGTIAAATNNNVGVAGIAPMANIMPLRVLGAKGVGYSYDILQAVRYAAGLSNDSGTLPARRADIINLSLSGASASQAEQDVYTQARARGVIIAAAAGNSSSSVPQYPASYAGVVAVSAVNIGRTLAHYSNFGASVDVAAPGGDSGD